jgi:LmbE family N-acetylglucosaminyl deacetylase
MEFFVNKSVIGFAAHPDDLEFTCTGTLFKLKKQGYEIIYVVVTNGENGFKSNLNRTGTNTQSGAIGCCR